MKERVSITLDKEVLEIVNSLLNDKKFRNRSHVFEMAIEALNQIEKEKRGKS